MPRQLTDQQVRLLRLRAQRLTPALAISSGVADVARSAFAIQAQDPRAAALAVRPRSTGLLASDVAEARNHTRSIVRTWAMRGTLHLLAAEDAGRLVALLGPAIIAGGARRRHELGLDENVCDRGLQAIRAILASQGPLTRAELVERLAARGIVLDPKSQAPFHLVGYAALSGVICFGPDRTPLEPTYVLVEDWLGVQNPLPPEIALAELARRYLHAYGPAELEDFTWWSGLPKRQARAAWKLIADQLTEVTLGDRRGWMLTEQAASIDEQIDTTLPAVRLLPSFDAYILGYRNRDSFVPSPFAARINRGGGMLHPVLVVDGLVAGTWRQVHKRITQVLVEPFEDLPETVFAPLAAEVADLARFQGRDAQLTVTSPAPAE
ncbi:MAG: hypothetical protein JWO42_3034 [Chloroflexi bacterium]|nr:hypothetical protein [Chloroflexota bacterium]